METSDWKHWKRWYQIEDKLKKASKNVVIKNSLLKCPLCHSRNIEQLFNPRYLHCRDCGTEFKLKKVDKYW